MKTGFQIKNITHATSVSAVAQTYSFDFIKEFKHAVGVVLVANAGAGTGIKLALKDHNKRFLNEVPYEALKANQEIDRRNLFVPVYIPAYGNRITIELSALTITTAINFDIIFILSNDCKPFTYKNYQVRRYTVPSGTSGNYSCADFDFDTEYKKAVGLAIIHDQAYKYRVSLKNQSGSILMHQIHSDLIAIDNDSTLNQPDRYLPIEVETTDVTAHVEIETISTFSSDLTFDIIFLLSND